MIGKWINFTDKDHTIIASRPYEDVLGAIAEREKYGGYGSTKETILEALGVDNIPRYRATLTKALKDMKEMGLVEGCYLHSEYDGQLCGRGYVLTLKGQLI